MAVAIRTENLGKSYPIHRQETCTGYRTLRDSLVEFAHNRIGGLLGRRGVRKEPFWALQDVEFEVQPGEVVGIIGRNGAGKSTLLKILSRITKPTTGDVRLRGRVGCLLEVGTGFHPELSGRENIYLNGAILGMTRREITRKFDEIVAFAEIEQFLDTPVKRYSSGMYVRLAFAVAAHLEPEILIVDEVLAVGDIAFQRKCMNRMGQVGRSGTTVLFVSHNMAAVEALCDRAILFEGGRLVQDGSAHELVREYHRRVMEGRDDPAGLLRDGGVLRSARLVDQTGATVGCVPLGGAFKLEIGCETTETLPDPVVGVGIDDNSGQRLLTLHTPLAGGVLPRLEGRCLVTCQVDRFPLSPGEYWMKLAITSRGKDFGCAERVLGFSVVDGNAFGEGRGFTRGMCVAASRWSVDQSAAVF